MTTLLTKERAQKSLFVYVHDTITNKIKRVVVPSDFQVGLVDTPSSFDLQGKLSLRTVTKTIVNDSAVNLTKHDTVVRIDKVTTPSNNQVVVNLPTDSSPGQLHVVHDASGTARTVPIVVQAADSSLIDGNESVSINDAYGSITFIKETSSWHVMARTATRSAPVYEHRALAGIYTSTTAVSSSKETVGAFYFDPAVIGYDNSVAYVWHAILQCSESAVPCVIELYDTDGITAGAGSVIAGSELTSSLTSLAHVSVDISNVMSGATAAGVIEARVWKTIDPSTTSSVTCYGAGLDVQYG